MQVFRVVVSDWNGGDNHDLGVFSTLEAARVVVSNFGTPHNVSYPEGCIFVSEVWEDGKAFVAAKYAADKQAHAEYIKRVAKEHAQVAKAAADKKAREAFEAGRRAAFEKSLAAEWEASKGVP